MIPKHHFIEHYPQLIKAFGPLVLLWTMRFEAKHHFFKKLVRQTCCFRNIVTSMAMKHQYMIAYHLHSSKINKTAVSVSRMTRVPFEVLHENIQEFLLHRFPEEKAVYLTHSIDCKGTTYGIGMMVAYGSTAGLPDFGEILQILIVHDRVVFCTQRVHGTGSILDVLSWSPQAQSK